MLTRKCPTCAGHGRVKGTAMVAAAALSDVRRIELTSESAESSHIELRAGSELLDAVRECESGTGVVLVEDDTLPPGRYEVSVRTTT